MVVVCNGRTSKRQKQQRPEEGRCDNGAALLMPAFAWVRRAEFFMTHENTFSKQEGSHLKERIVCSLGWRYRRWIGCNGAHDAK